MIHTEPLRPLEIPTLLIFEEIERLAKITVAEEKQCQYEEILKQLWQGYSALKQIQEAIEARNN